MLNAKNCCHTGKPVPDSYIPLGECITIRDIRVYSSNRPADVPSRGLLLLLPDGFGLARHNLILADRFASEGWHVLVPDYFEGDPLPIQLLRRDHALSIDEQPWPEEDKQKLRDLDFPAWLQRHNHPRVSSLLNDLIAGLSEQAKNTTIVGVGYCFGGKHVLRLAKSSLKAAAAFHPSFVEAEDVAGIQVPLYAGLAEKDDMVPVSLPEDLQAWAVTKMKANIPFTMEIYPGVGHGFAARPDTNDDVIRTQYERAFQKSVEHLAKTVGGEN
ncbi:uncharacterized protein Z519_09499 [Cladophialophora bantiana CBS 173.52]|uniref:Dienelactone hydrolase domain-containing protein n=1 Tax=Cladophialophora bantiana (strain ATCC 10958 / CBS 173.52 / CDC B-1940 / NIH 8579) TaxID=1442370 RepID=A0A0D2HA20_CLAB1|nr:uncharacterized protein Z519_09499 [Cladophialophora bantiana CBS 173.52]KIW90068.1 hypothetical protein Z519_09499 [Cladophialophora bantiana CBS 173.52]